jgi:hypothetical protein
MWTVKDQASPEALRIVEGILGKVPEPFMGLPDEFWRVILDGKHQDYFKRFLDIMTTDFLSFCALMYRIAPKGKPEQPFLFNRPQRLLWSQMARMIDAGRPLFIIILKARQMGMSTVCAAWVFWTCWRKRNVKCLTVAHEKPLAEHIIGMLRVAYEGLPNIKGIKPIQKQKHAESIPRGEMIFADRNSQNTTHLAKNLQPRGGSYEIIWESEKAFYFKPELLDGALIPSLPSLGTPERLMCSFIRESTPYGMNFFKGEYDAAEHIYSCQSEYGQNEGREDVAVFYPWEVHDEIQFGGYAIPVSKSFKLTPDEKKKREAFSRVRRCYDGKDVSLEQMAWYRETLEGRYQGDEQRFEMEYPSSDRNCWLLTSDNAFRHVMGWLQATVQDAPSRAEEAWARMAAS